MPLVALACCAYAAGLLLGFGGAVIWGTIIAVSAVMWSAMTRRVTMFTLAVVLAVGMVVARAASSRDLDCARAMQRSGVTTLVLLVPIQPGESARGVSASGNCRVHVRLRAGSARVAAGSRVRVAGIVGRQEDRIDVRARTVRVDAGPPPLARLRASAGRRVDALYGSDAPMARALLLADADDIARDVRDRFADAGIIHMLSVSGLHVGIIAQSVRALCLALRLGALAADAVTLGITAAFVVFIGAPPPAVRSAAMLGGIIVARLVQRPTSPWAIWGAGCALPLVDPRIVLDVGWQLSAAGMAGLIASRGVARRWAGGLDGWRRQIADNLIATSVASVATAPLVAWTFGRVSIIALATNLAAAPLFGVAQPLLFASLVVAPIDPVARFLAYAARTTLGAIDLVARWGAAVPFAVLHTEPGAATAILLGVAAVALLAACAGRHARRSLVIALGAAALAAWWPVLIPGPGRLELYALDVGQGDALALRTPRGRWILIDAGGVWRGGDAAAATVAPLLRRRGGEVAVLSLSHPHADHIGGAPGIIERFSVGAVWDGAYVSPSDVYRTMLDVARRRGAPWRRVSVGDSTTIDDVGIRVLAPDSSWMSALDDPNEASVVLRVSYGRVRFLFTGDAERAEEAWLVEHYGGSLRADVLKVAHHGSSTSSTPLFLDQVRPRVAIVSVGAGNSYGHPSDEVLRALDVRGAHVLRTDDVGTIVLSSNGDWFDVSADGMTWRYYGAH